MIVSPRLLNGASLCLEPHQQQQHSGIIDPSVTVQGAFIAGGNGSGHLTITRPIHAAGLLDRHRRPHTVALRRARLAPIAMPTITAGSNGSYYFSNRRRLRQARPRNTPPPSSKILSPAFFSSTAHSLCRTTGAVNRKFHAGPGLRTKAQNHIHDHADRLRASLSPGPPAIPGKALQKL